MPVLWIHAKIVKDARNILNFNIQELVTLSELVLKIVDQAPEILLFRPIIWGEDDKIGCDKKKGKKKLQPHEPL